LSFEISFVKDRNIEGVEERKSSCHINRREELSKEP
jgi:hypothetical protein